MNKFLFFIFTLIFINDANSESAAIGNINIDIPKNYHIEESYSKTLGDKHRQSTKIYDDILRVTSIAPIAPTKGNGGAYINIFGMHLSRVAKGYTPCTNTYSEHEFSRKVYETYLKRSEYKLENFSAFKETKGLFIFSFSGDTNEDRVYRTAFTYVVDEYLYMFSFLHDRNMPQKETNKIEDDVISSIRVSRSSSECEANI